MTTHETAEKFEFKAEVKQLLDILVHSLYSSREIFLRELISNSSDALDKLRFESTRGTKINDADLPLEINITLDPKKNIITISDTGIGMTRDELITNIGTIAKSGSADFVKMLKESKDDAGNIIGRFGVGFYSVFMVANEVVLRTRSFREGEPGLEWKSDGLGDYTISELDDNMKRGTTIEIHLKEEAKEFTEDYRIEQTIKKHSNFIGFPIHLGNKKINAVSAVWREPKTSITKEQYDEFYKFLSYDSDEPLSIIHTAVDAPIQFNTLMFIPKKNFDIFGFNRDNYGLDLYVRRVLIQHNSKEILPEYLSFVKGVVDSEDLPLNISRETLQENAIFRKISSSVTTQVLNHLTKMAKDEPEKYADFWREHQQVFRLGYNDFTNMEKFKELLRFNTSGCEDKKGLVSLDEYAGRIKNEQKEIYFALGSSREAIDLDPKMEIFKAKDIEVLYCYDPADEIVLSSIMKYKELEFRSVDSVDSSKLAKIPDVNNDAAKPAELSADDKLHFESLLAKMKTYLGEKVEDVKSSERLVNSPAVLISKDDSMTSSMKRIMKMMKQDNMPDEKKTFEVNKNHHLIRALLDVYKKNDGDAYIMEVTEHLYEAAKLTDGDLPDVHTLVSRMNRLLEKSTDLYLASMK